MNGIDDNHEPDDVDRREKHRRAFALAGKVCLGAAMPALPMAVVDPNGWWLTGAVAGIVLYLVLSHFSIVSDERGAR